MEGNRRLWTALKVISKRNSNSKRLHVFALLHALLHVFVCFDHIHDLVTLCAFEWLLTCVGSHMSLQII